MADYLVLEDCFAPTGDGRTTLLKAGRVISDAEYSVPGLQATGGPLVLYTSGTMAAPVAAFRRQLSLQSRDGDLVSLLLAAGAIGGGGATVLGGDATGPAAANTVERLQGRAISAAAPTNGQALIWNGSAWVPSTIPSSVSSVFGRTGAVAAAGGDYAASQVTNDSGVSGAGVSGALDTLGTLVANKADVAGQLGGTPASPDVRGLRSTISGGTLLTMGSVADGELLGRVGTDIVGVTPSGGGPSVEEITGLSTTRHYRFGSDPLNAVNQHTVCAVVRVGSNTVSTSFNNRWVMGTINGVGGFGIRYSGNFTADVVTRLGVSMYDGGGTLRTFEYSGADVGLKFCVVVVVFNYDEFGNTTAILWINGQRHVAFFTSAVTGQTAGGNLSIGAAADGAYQHGIDTGGFVHGAAYVTRLLNADEVRELSEACLESRRLESIPSGGDWTNAWRVDGGDPGATWAPFVGATSLTRSGTAATYGVRDNPTPL
jgi:hypothetical protein